MDRGRLSGGEDLLFWWFLVGWPFGPFPCVAADVKNVNEGAVYGEKDAVTTDAFAVNELPYFLREEIIEQSS